MAKGIYIGIDNKAKKVNKAYVGIGEIAKKAKKIYLGVDGIAKLVWSGSVPAGQVIFTSSQTWTVPDGVTSIDIFCVGGGASGSKQGSQYVEDRYDAVFGSGGGGGGFTATKLNYSVTPGSQFVITVGAGGIAITSGGYGIRGGGVSSFGNVLTANGGGTITNGQYGSSQTGGSNGGSGGGSGGCGSSTTNYRGPAGDGGSDGSKGEDCLEEYTGYVRSFGGTGQTTTTRAFGDTTGTLFAGGGGGGSGYNSAGWANAGVGKDGGGNGGLGSSLSDTTNMIGKPGTANTGGGGGGHAVFAYYDVGYYIQTSSPGDGGSGIVIVRWREQQV